MSIDSVVAKRSLLVPALLGLVLRLLWVWFAQAEPEAFADPWRYIASARQIAEGAGYRDGVSGALTAYYPPGYPFFLGFIGMLLRSVGALDHLAAVALTLQAVLGAGVVFVWSLLACRLWSRRVGELAAFGLALYPNLLLHTGVLLSETLFLFVSGLALLALLAPRKWPDGLTTSRLLAHGILLGVAILIRPQSSLYLLPVVALWWLGLGLRQTVWCCAVTLAAAIAVVAPWTIRNALVFDAFVPVSTNNGDNLCIGHHPEAQGGFSITANCDTGFSIFDGESAELARDREAGARARSFAFAQLNRQPWLVVQRLRITLSSDHDAVSVAEEFGERPWLPPSVRWLLTVASDGAWFCLLLMFTLCVRSVVGTSAQLALVAGGLMTLLPVMLVFGDARFKMPLIPILILVTAAGVDRFVSNQSSRRAQASPRATRAA
ncbi:MAG: 4-amino-4-deoxy-L-arabinose transferase-like glycosyltransferase [Hyphomicrobiaceae bacterium]|jgi:4-amino-4-deoxy-L-arabinose transferase-like glycosyltransferase